MVYTCRVNKYDLGFRCFNIKTGRTVVSCSDGSRGCGDRLFRLCADSSVSRVDARRPGRHPRRPRSLSCRTCLVRCYSVSFFDASACGSLNLYCDVSRICRHRDRAGNLPSDYKTLLSCLDLEGLMSEHREIRASPYCSHAEPAGLAVEFAMCGCAAVCARIF